MISSRGPIGPPSRRGKTSGDDSDESHDTVDSDNRKEWNYDRVLMEPLKNFCFETGDMFYNMTKRFSEAVLDYNEAYTALSEELKKFHKKWKELGDDYYK